MMLAALLCVACSTDGDSVQESLSPTPVSLSVSLDCGSRAVFGTAESIDCLYYEIYRVDAQGEHVSQQPVYVNTTSVSNGHASVTAMLVPELNYKAYFWAYDSSAQWSTSGTMSFSSLTMPATGIANSDMWDAFYGTATLTSETFNQGVTLTRPLSMLNACVPDSVWAAISDPATASVTVVVHGGALSLDGFTNTPLIASDNVQTFTATGLDGESFEGGYRRLISCFLLPAESVKVVLTVKDGTNTIIDQFVIEDVPLAANRRTNLKGVFAANI